MSNLGKETSNNFSLFPKFSSQFIFFILEISLFQIWSFFQFHKWSFAPEDLFPIFYCVTIFVTLPWIFHPVNPVCNLILVMAKPLPPSQICFFNHPLLDIVAPDISNLTIYLSQESPYLQNTSQKSTISTPHHK